MKRYRNFTFLDDKENLIDDTYKMWYDYEFAKRIPKLIH